MDSGFQKGCRLEVQTVGRESLYLAENCSRPAAHFQHAFRPLQSSFLEKIFT